MTKFCVNVQLSNRCWYQIYFTSDKSATIYRYNKRKETINGMGGPIFNCKVDNSSNEWVLNLVKDTATTKRIWSQVKQHLDFLTHKPQPQEDPKNG